MLPALLFSFYDSQGITLVANDTLTITNTSATDQIKIPLVETDNAGFG